MRVIGGICSYEDGVKTVAGDQFSPTRRVKVELNFSIDQGDDADIVAMEVLNKAQNFVCEKLGLGRPTAAAKERTIEYAKAPKPTSDALTASNVEVDVGKGIKPPKAPLRAPAKGKTKADLAAEAGVSAKPAQTDLEDALESPSLTPIADAMVAENDAENDPLDELTAGPVKEITDADLNAAVRDKNVAPFNTAENPGAPRIRKLVASFLAPADADKQPVCRLIPQGKRTAFLEALKKLA